MTVDMVARTISVIVAPVVMITSCAIMLGGLLTRYAAINDRLRVMARERFDIVRTRVTGQPDVFTVERLQEIDTQVPDLLHRHGLLRDALLAGYMATMVFVVSMFVIAGAALRSSSTFSTIALLVFLAGTTLLLICVMLVIIEVRSSHRAVTYEMQRVGQLGK